MIYTTKFEETYTKDKKKETRTIVVEIDSEKEYSGNRQSADSEERYIRKLYGLPVTKALVYYSDSKSENSRKNIVSYKILDFFDITDKWSTLLIKTEDGEEVRILSMYLADMQSPTFVDDMKNYSTE